MAESVSTTSRRSFLAAAAVAMGAPSVAVSVAIADPLTSLWADFEAARDRMEQFFATAPRGTTDEECQRACEPVFDLARQISETDAATYEGLKIKARALLWFDEGGDVMDGDTTDAKLVRGLVHGLLNLPTT